jgi:tRNA dimethylallyltransferase
MGGAWQGLGGGARHGGARAGQALIVAGPTCSGKSALAMRLAAELDGTVINADSMQVYRELRVLTARPTPEDEAAVPHALYGVRAAAEPGSAAWWRGAALAAMDASAEAGRVPILTGGTGLYLASLTRGIANIPDPGAEARAEARSLLAAEGPAALHARLAAADADTAATLRPSDSQRIARAWEVLRGTGRGLAAWHQAAPAPTDAAWSFRMVLLDPPRPSLRAAIAGRFDAMLDAGALDEVRALVAQDLDPALPAMRAHGVPELSAFLAGEITLSEAARRATLATGQYLKRQATWLRGRSPVPPALTHTIYARYADCTQFPERDWCDLMRFINLAG